MKLTQEARDRVISGVEKLPGSTMKASKEQAQAVNDTLAILGVPIRLTQEGEWPMWENGVAWFLTDSAQHVFRCIEVPHKPAVVSWEAGE